jgi:hypothetical protein
MNPEPKNHRTKGTQEPEPEHLSTHEPVNPVIRHSTLRKMKHFK